VRSDWESVSLSEILTLSKEKFKPEGPSNQFYIGLEHVVKDEGCLTESAGVELVNTVKNKFERGQVLYGKLRPYLNKVYLAKESGVCSTDILVFTANENIVTKFYFQLMLGRKFVNDMSANTNGVNLPRVRTDYVKQYSVPLPPLPEQRAIVSKIEALFSDLDNGIADLKKAQAQLKIYRQAVLKKAFEGELTKEWREKQTDLPSADELLEQIKVEREAHFQKQLGDWEKAVEKWEKGGKEGKKPSKPKEMKVVCDFYTDEIKELPKISKEWMWTKSGQHFYYVTSGSRGWAKYYSDKGGIFVRITNLNFDTLSIDLSPKKIQYVSPPSTAEGLRTRIQKGDFLFSITGELGMFAIAPEMEEAYVNQHVSLARPSKKQNLKYLGYWIIARTGGHFYLNQKTKGAVKAGLGLDDMVEFPIPLCGREEQDVVVMEVERRLSVCEKLEEGIQEGLEKSKALRQSILKKAFEGKLLTDEEIEKCKQAEDYEPASELLKKIRAEKEMAK